MQFTHSIFLGAALVAVSLPAFAQRSQVPVEIEGPIQSIEQNSLRDGVILKVNGVTIQVPSGVIAGGKVRTPTSSLTTIQDIVSTQSFHGRPDLPGFQSGLAIVTGKSDANGVWADNVFLQPAENTIIGAVTANDLSASSNPDDPAKGFRIEGVEVVLMPGSPTSGSYPPGKAVPYDSRLRGLGAKNAAGLAIRPETIQPGAEASVEGYLGIDPVSRKDVFYAFSLSSSGELDRPAATATILRAQCRVRSSSEIELDVRGAIYPWIANATVSVNPPNASYNGGRPYNAAVPVVRDVSDPGTGAFRYDNRLNSTGGCPPTVIVKFGNAPDVSANVEVR